MTSTEFLGLNLPETDDKFDIGDINENAEIIDRAIKDLSDSPRKIGASSAAINTLNPPIKTVIGIAQTA